VIEADKQSLGGRAYTSGRITTATSFSQAYGIFEARIQIPPGQGMWPAFWMLGNNINSVGWPNCGETDTMENIGREPGTVHGTIHGPGSYSIGGGYTLPGTQKFSDGFHVFAVEWTQTPAMMKFSVDGNVYETVTPSDTGAAGWVFNRPFFIILNLAIGGSWPGNPDASTPFPARMLVDYVRVYTHP
jgi:beta-glucanase (GH16 family)